MFLETEEYVTTTKRILESVSSSEDSTLKKCIDEMETLSIGKNAHTDFKIILILKKQFINKNISV